MLLVIRLVLHDDTFWSSQTLDGWNTLSQPMAKVFFDMQGNGVVVTNALIIW